MCLNLAENIVFHVTKERKEEKNLRKRRRERETERDRVREVQWKKDR